MTTMVPREFETLLALVCSWSEEQEAYIIAAGIPLTPSQLADARRVGVAEPERIRLLSVPSVPFPTHPAVAAAARAANLVSTHTAGLTARYGIFVRADCWGQRDLVAHELVHTMQHERMGGIEPFLRRYLVECVTVGYRQAPLEQEAVRVAQAVCRLHTNG